MSICWVEIGKPVKPLPHGTYVTSTQDKVKEFCAGIEPFVYDIDLLDKQTFSDIVKQSHVVFTNISDKFYETREILHIIKRAKKNKQVIFIIEPEIIRIPLTWKALVVWLLEIRSVKWHYGCGGYYDDLGYSN